jgi:hypothetical protein
MPLLRTQLVAAGCFTLLACVGCSDWKAVGELGGLRGSVTKAADYELGPDGVVEQQMDALSHWQDDPQAVERVFSFASPGNRAVTGPVDHFERLVEEEAYLPLTNSQGYVVGRAVESDDAATVLVTLIDRSGTLLAYRFYLSRQASEPQRRWMTDAVLRFNPSDDATDEAAEPLIPTI